MNTRATYFFKNCFMVIAIFYGSTLLYSQKLNNIQQGNLLAPENVKVDGKLFEWSKTLQAYNKSTLLSYTLSNDDKYLYLIIKSDNQSNNNKIMAGGISFIVSTSNEKRKRKENDGYIITYPIIDRREMRKALTEEQKEIGGQKMSLHQRMSDPSLRDSAVVEIRGKLLTMMRGMEVSGFKEISDSLISVYNEYGIKVSPGFNESGSFQYELAIPLTLLNLSTDIPANFRYHVRVNGLPVNDNGVAQAAESNPQFLAFIAPTEFSGQYTLARKE